MISDNPPGLGTTYIDQGWMGSFRGDVVEFQKPSRVVFRETLSWFGSPVMVVDLLYEFSPAGEGTALHHTAETDLHGMMRLMKPMVRIVGRGERQRTVKALKKAAESAARAEALRAA